MGTRPDWPAMLESQVDRVAAFAERQQGAVSMVQLERAGLSKLQARAWIRQERLGPTAARGVFRMPGAEPTWKQSLWVAILAGPPSSVASHLSAAALRGLLRPPEKPHVTVPRGSSGRFGGAVVHHATVPVADSCRFEGMRVTGVARTIVDCAVLLDQPTLDGLVDAAIGRNLTAYRRVRAAWDRAGRVRGEPEHRYLQCVAGRGVLRVALPRREHRRDAGRRLATRGTLTRSAGLHTGAHAGARAREV